MQTIKLKSPYRSAWKKFGWDKETWGVSLLMSQIKRAANDNEKVIFQFRDNKIKYEINANEALEFVKNNKTQILIQLSRVSGVIPLKICKKIK